ncbi:MAG: sulfurtransferase TusA family protein [Atopobiaceae bacterium]
MAQEAYEVTDTVDITNLVCPMTFVTAKAALAELEIGEVLRVHLAAGEPMENVPRSFADDGQKVLALRPSEDGAFDLDVKKLEDE